MRPQKILNPEEGSGGGYPIPGRNEAAERLREAMQLRHGEGPCFDIERLDAALAAERRATVERIKMKIRNALLPGLIAEVIEILEQEADR